MSAPKSDNKLNLLKLIIDLMDFSGPNHYYPRPAQAFRPCLIFEKRTGGVMRKRLWLSGLVVASIVFAAPFAQRVKSQWAERRAATSAARIATPSSARDIVTETIQSNGARPLLTPISVQISGEVAELGAEATPLNVVVRVGVQQLPAVVTGNQFTVTLSRVRRQDMVSIEASTSRVQYRSLLGSAELLKRQAGADGVLNLSENPGLRVSPLSTAIHFFASRELGGRLPLSDDEQDKAMRAVYGPDLAPASSLLSQAALGATTLPDGYANGRALLSDRDPYRLFLNANAPVRGGADSYVRAALVGAFGAADLDRDWVIVSGRMPMDQAAFFQPNVQLMLRAAGGFSVLSSQGRRNPLFSTNLVNGELQLTPQGQAYTDQLVFRQVDVGGPSVRVVERATVTGESYRRIMVGKRLQLWLQTQNVTISYPQYPALATSTRQSTAFVTAGALEDVRVPVVEADVLGRRAMPYFCLRPTGVSGEPDTLRSCEFAMHTLGTNGVGQIDGLGAKIDGAMTPQAASGSAGVQWQLQANGSLRVDGPDYSVSYWRFGISDAGAADAMFYMATNQSAGGTEALSGHTLIINGNQPAFFSATDPIGTWKYGTFDGLLPYAYETNAVYSITRFTRNADGSQSQEDRAWETAALTDAPEILFYNRSGWRMIGLELYDTRYRANIGTGIPNTSNFSSCAAATAQGAAQCAPARVRYFRPLARSGNRWYGIEDLYTRPTLTSYTAPFEFDRLSRPNLYEKL
jgi:hypothetical protein